MTVDDVIRKIRADLEWRGPSGKPLGHVVLTRDEAKALTMNTTAVPAA